MTARTTFLILLAAVVGGCATAGPGSRLPERIVIERGGFIPEGIEYDTAAGRFLVGSMVDGTVYALANDGTLTALAVDDELVSSIGIEVDEPRDRLLVANSDFDAVRDGEGPGVAKLGIYRLSTGARIAMVDLAPVADADDGATLFVNDVTVDDDGNVYLTDTFLNQIYRVDTNNRASVLHRFEPTTGLQLNGIVHHRAGFLIVVAAGTQGLLYRVPLDDPSAAEPIALSQPATGADGLLWSADGRLIVVSNSSSSALAYRSDDNWVTAALVGTARFEGQATTGAAAGGEVYVVQPQFAGDEPPVVLRADFR